MQKLLSITFFSLLYALVSTAPAPGPQAPLPATSWAQPSAAYTPSPSASGQQIFTFPLQNGFPNIQIPSSALTAIEQQARGSLPNSPLPTSLSVSFSDVRSSGLVSLS